MTALRLAVSAAILARLGHAVLVRDHSDPSQSGGAYRMDTSAVFEMTLDFAAGQTRTCETRNLSPHADPVLHLLIPKTGDGAVTEAARDDDSAGNLNARVTFTAVTAGNYRLILRANWNSGQGTADLFCDNQPVAFQLPVGGAFKRLENLRAGETLTAVPLPKGPSFHIMYTLDDNGRLLERYQSAANQSTGRPLSNSAVQIVMLGLSYPDHSRPIRLVRNDSSLPGHDPDRDGLGTELERQIGTCSTTHEVVGNWDCSRTVDPRDTDGDGIPDGVELLGAIVGSPYQLLPKWGANPLHKDIFLEVDFMAQSKTETPRRMSPATAMAMAAIYGDSETDPALRLLHAQSLGNPDLQPGISLHLDIGQDPPDDSPEQVFANYGDWGGYTFVAPVCDSQGSHCRGADAADVWQTTMNRNRTGLFHYALGYSGSGGQAPLHSSFLNLPLDNAASAAHEFGHTLGLDHKGPDHSGVDANCKPNYPSLMSYAYLYASSTPTFSDGYGRGALNDVSLTESRTVSDPNSAAGRRYLADLRDVFGFNVDVNTGNVDWNRDGAFSGGTVKYYANDNGSGCEFTRVNTMRLGGQTDGPPALARLGSMTAVFYADDRDRKIWLETTNDDLTCPNIADGFCGPPLARKAVNETWNSGVLSVSARRIAAGAQKAILVVFRTNTGLFETTMTSDFRWSAAVPIPVGSPALEDVSLTGGEAQTFMGFRDVNGNAVVKTRDNATGSWTADEVARDVRGNTIGPLGLHSAPALLQGSTPKGGSILFGLFPVTPQGMLSLYTRNETTHRWVKSPWQFPNSLEGTIGRPAMSWEPFAAGAPVAGRLRILYLQRSADGHRIVRQRVLRVNGIAPVIVVKGALPNAPVVINSVTVSLPDEDHDNVWYYGAGVDLFFEPGVDSNVRAAISTALVEEGAPQPHFIEFRPKADGVADFVQRNWDDWAGMAADTCRTLQSAGAQVACGPWPF